MATTAADPVFVDTNIPVFASTAMILSYAGYRRNNSRRLSGRGRSKPI